MYVLLGAYQCLRALAKISGEDVSERTLRVVRKGGVAATLPTHPLVWVEAQQYPSRGYCFPGRYDKQQPVQALT